MGKSLINIFLLISLLNIFLTLSFAIEKKDEEKNVRYHPAPDTYRKVLNTQPPKSIIPPVVPYKTSFSPSSMSSPPPLISPSPTPGISQVTGSPTSSISPFSPPWNIPSTPGIPAHNLVPSIPVTIEPVQPVIVQNSIGRVINKGRAENGVLWIEVEDSLFGQIVKIDIKNLRNTPIVKQGGIMNFEDINIRDIVNVLYRSEGDENIANFINIMTKEQFDLLRGNKQGTILKGENSTGEPGK